MWKLWHSKSGSLDFMFRCQLHSCMNLASRDWPIRFIYGPCIFMLFLWFPVQFYACFTQVKSLLLYMSGSCRNASSIVCNSSYGSAEILPCSDFDACTHSVICIWTRVSFLFSVYPSLCLGQWPPCIKFKFLLYLSLMHTQYFFWLDSTIYMECVGLWVLSCELEN
jgi:hypothetical protein